MVTPEIGKLERVPLRTVWPDEARHFTPWLAQNLDQLGAELDLELELVRQEVTLPGGAGRVDILAKQARTDAIVMIENQLEGSNDGHCLNLLGYAASMDASILVWVARGFTDYHRSIIKWLNNGESIAIYAVTVEAWGIGESVAARFHLVEGPQSQIGAEQGSSASLNTNQRYARFYGPIVDQLRRAGILPVGRGRWRSFQTGYPRLVYALGLQYEGEAWAFFDAYGIETQPAFHALVGYRAQIDRELGDATIEWHEGERQSWITVKTKASLDDTEEQHEATREWMASNLLKLKDAIQPRLDQIMAELQPAVAADDDDAPTTRDDPEAAQ